MPRDTSSPRTVATDTGAEGQTGQDDRRKLTCETRPDQPTAADTWRAHAPIHLSAAAGVRPAGALGWQPIDPPPPEDALAIARRRELTRRRVAEQQRRWAQLREVGRYWTEAA
jgi:hypothetical protein